MNKSETKFDFSLNIYLNYVLTFLFLLIAIIGIVGNVLVIISIRIDARMRRSLTNRLIIHVACCDLIILLFNLPDLIQFVSSTNGNWILSKLACKLIRTNLVLAQYASVLTMCAVTIERFIGIVYPLRSKFLREKEHVTRITFLVWLFSLICASPNLIYLRVKISSSRRSCLLQYSEKNFEENQRGYIIHKSIESTIFYFLPLLLQLFCYAKIARQLYHVDETLQTSFPLVKQNTIHRTQDDLDNYDEDFIDNDQNLGSKCTLAESSVQSSNGYNNNFSSRNINNLFPNYVVINNNSPLTNSKTRQLTKRSNVAYNALKSRRSVIKMLAIVVLIYFISFSPQVLIFVLFDTNAIRNVPKFIQTPYFIAFTMLLVTISSASNPIVYAIFSSKFRQGFAKVLRRLCFCRRPIFTYHPNENVQQIPKTNYHFNRNRINSKKR